jgi:hypothetical protein
MIRVMMHDAQLAARSAPTFASKGRAGYFPLVMVVAGLRMGYCVLRRILMGLYKGHRLFLGKGTPEFVYKGTAYLLLHLLLEGQQFEESKWKTKSQLSYVLSQAWLRFLEATSYLTMVCTIGY